MLMAIACAGPDQNLYGKWEGDRDWKRINAATEEAARAFAAVNLTLKADRSFLLQDGGIPFEGSWIQSGETIELRVETILNRPLEQQQESTKKQAEFKVRYKDGKLYFKSPADSNEIELKKKAKPV